jgi:CP family cyanate transporter-like MFS transporter
MVGGALGNVLLPSLVKRWFPARTGLLVGAYSTAMAAGGAVASVSAAPIARAAGDAGWRWALAVWAVPALLAALPWLAVPRRPGVSRTAHTAMPLRSLARSPTAVALAAFFGFQAMQAYIIIGWTAQYLRDSGLDAATAGLLLGVNTVVVVPLNAVVPPLSVRPRLQRPLLLVFVACYVGGYLGLMAAPRTVPWLWMTLLAVGMSTFAMVLALIGLRARTPETTAALSTVVQGWGYVLAGGGPLLAGVLLGATGSYAGMFAVALAGVAALLATGWVATRERFVDDEVAARAERPVREPDAASPRG